MSLSFSKKTLELFAIAILTWLFFSFFYIQHEHFDALLLWIILPFVYGLIFIFSLSQKHLTLTLFSGVSFLSNGISPSLFFFYKNQYKYSGWSAVRNFHFTLAEFFPVTIKILIYMLMVIAITLIAKKYLIKNKLEKIKVDPLFKLGTKKFSKNFFLSEKQSTYLLILFILLLAILNEWMFDIGIALTGLTGNQPRLPFHMAGILYYLTRFVFPFFVFFLYMNSNRSFILALLLMVFSVWAGISQVSRTTIVMYFFPVISFAILDRKYSRLFLSIFLFFVFFYWVYFARHYVYLVEGGIASKNPAYSLKEVFLLMISQYGIGVDFFRSIYSLLHRIGGGQDIVLAYQYNADKFEGSLAHFMNCFVYQNPIFGARETFRLYNFSPPKGFALTSGCLTARVLIIAGKKYAALFLMALWTSFCLTLLEWVSLNFVKIFRKIEFGTVVSGLGVVFFAVTVQVHIFYFYLFSMFLISIILSKMLLFYNQYKKKVENGNSFINF